MKFIKGFILTATLVLATSVFANTQEEVCYNSVEAEITLKRLLNLHPGKLSVYLEILDKRNATPEVKKRLRETAFWVYNRKDLPENDFKELSFMRCITRTK
jgi:hypothetical protein